MSQDLFVVLHRRFVNGDDLHRWEKVDFVNNEYPAKLMCNNPHVDYSVGDLFGYVKAEEVSDINNFIELRSPLRVAVSNKVVSVTPIGALKYYEDPESIQNVFALAEYADMKRILAAASAIVLVGIEYSGEEPDFAESLRDAMRCVEDYCYSDRGRLDLDIAFEHISKYRNRYRNSVFFETCKFMLSGLVDRSILRRLVNIWMEEEDIVREFVEIVRHYIPYNIIALGRVGIEIPMVRNAV